MYEYENKDLAEDVGEIINSEVIIATSKYEVFVAVLETDRHFNTYGGSAEDVATLIYDNGLSYWNDEVAVFIDGEFKSVEELIEQLENFKDTDSLVEQIKLLDVEINDIQHQRQRIKPANFTEIAKLFEKEDFELKAVILEGKDIGFEFINKHAKLHIEKRFYVATFEDKEKSVYKEMKDYVTAYEILKRAGYVK